MRRLLAHPALIFAALLAWKVILFLFTMQPIPANDAYFYDGAVVNAMHGGAFVNPTVAISRPYSGTEFFSPYPPLYQFVLHGWMRVFGASAAAAIGLHVMLVGVFTVLVYRMFRQLQVETWVMHLAGGFLFVITFHDRPDTLAHVCGVGALWAMVGWQCDGSAGRRLWLSVAFVALAFLTSVQLGAMYAAVVGVTVLAQALLTGQRIPWLTLLVIGLTPLILLAVGKFGFPRWWTGFIENARDNPSSLGLHPPDLDGILKLVRSLPGFLLVSLLLFLSLPRIKGALAKSDKPQLALFLGVMVGLFGVVIMGLCYLTANYVLLFGAYLQPLVVGMGLAWLTRAKLLVLPRSVVIAITCGAIAIGGLRAMGQTTWGVLCARDVSYREACGLVARALRAGGEKRTAVVSAAYLYDAAAQRDWKLIHSDYLVPLRGRATESDLTGLLRLQPSRLLLTQFDYYRRYEGVIAELRRTRGDVEVRINNTARVQAPDAERRTQKLVQHVAWAPVIVEIDWPAPGEAK